MCFYLDEFFATFCYAVFRIFWALFASTLGVSCWGCLYSLMALILSYSAFIFYSSWKALMYYRISSYRNKITWSLQNHARSRSSFVISFQAHIDYIFQLFWVKLRNRAVSKLYKQFIYFPRIIFNIKLAWFAASKGCLNVQSSYSKHPKAQISLF